jgi:histidinol dehydrogenase
MSKKVYIMLDVAEGKDRDVLRSLRGKIGVVSVDSLEGPSDIMVLCEADDRERLARLTVDVLSSIEHVTEDFSTLLVRENGEAAETQDGGIAC